MSVFRSLVSHLFVRHSMPEFLLRSWFRDDMSDSGFEYQVFRHIAQGHGIRTFQTGISMGRRTSHHFMNAPDHLTVRAAIRWAQVRSLGGDSEIASSIATTCIGQHFGNEEFWERVIVWFIKHQEFDNATTKLIFRFLNNQRFGVGNFVRCVRDRSGTVRRKLPSPAQPRLSMKGRTPDALLREALAWEEERQAYGSDSEFVWFESGIRGFEYQDGLGTTWAIAELLGNGALLDEGRRMRHCVGSYSDLCVDGHSTIWSMSRSDGGSERGVLTIEIDPARRQIVQARGFANRLPSDEEIGIMRRWARESWLDMDSLTHQGELA